MATLGAAASELRGGTARCEAPRSVRASVLASPVDGRRLSRPIALPELGLVRGATTAPSEAEARLGLVHDLSTWKRVEDARPPVRAGVVHGVVLAEGRALAVDLVLDALGETRSFFGAIVAVDAAPGTRRAPPRTQRLTSDPSPLVGDAALARRALDDRAGALVPGDVVVGSAPGLGALALAIGPYASRAWVPPESALRFAVAHGAATGLSLASIGLSMLERRPTCVVLCSAGALGLPGDRAFVERFARVSDAERARASRALGAVELGVFGASLATVLVPSGRRGVFSRVELLEDVLVLGEAWLVGWTTPLTLQARLGRARPGAIARGTAIEGRGDVTAPLFAPRTTAVASVAGAATSLLVVEEASVLWTIPAALVLASLTATTAYLEVRAGEAFLSDVPLAIVGGVGSGAAVVLWHALFWRGWPGDSARGALPLRLVAAPLGGPSLAIAGAF